MSSEKGYSRVERDRTKEKIEVCVQSIYNQRVSKSTEEANEIAIKSAREIDSVYSEVSGEFNEDNLSNLFGKNNSEGVDSNDIEFDAHTLRKVIECIESNHDVTLGGERLQKAIAATSQLNSLCSLFVATLNLCERSSSLVEAYDEANQDPTKVDSELYQRYYAAVFIVIGECFLLSTPFTYNMGWKATRWMNNKLLYRIRYVNNTLYRTILSRTHYTVRGIPAASLNKIDTAVDSDRSFSSKEIIDIVFQGVMSDIILNKAYSDNDTSIEQKLSNESLFSETKEYTEDWLGFLKSDLGDKEINEFSNTINRIDENTVVSEIEEHVDASVGSFEGFKETLRREGKLENIADIWEADFSSLIDSAMEVIAEVYGKAKEKLLNTLPWLGEATDSMRELSVSFFELVAVVQAKLEKSSGDPYVV